MNKALNIWCKCTLCTHLTWDKIYDIYLQDCIRLPREIVIVRRPRPLREHKKNSYFSTKTYVVGTQKNRLNETVLSSTQNIY